MIGIMRTRYRRRTSLLAALVLLGCIGDPAAAHPGHAMDVVPPESAMHYLLQPEHAAWNLLAVACVLIALAAYRKFVSSKRSLLH